MNYYIGIDAGGTKTESVLVDETGHILLRTIRRGCNPMDMGIQPVLDHIRAVVNELIAAAPGPVVSLYGGIAGLDRIDVGMDSFLSEFWPDMKIRTEDDGFNLISGTLGHVDGCGMVCGTGSSLFARINGKPALHIGGLGYLIDTGGSGFELGRDALKAAFRYLDGRGENTVLVELLEKKFGKPLRYCMPEIYGGGRPFIASLAHTVFDGYAQGDEICRQLFDEGACRLAELTLAAAPHFHGEFPVVMSGGILTAYPHYAEAVRSMASPRANMILATVPPVYGAVVESLWNCGIHAPEENRVRFMEDYRALCAAERKA